MHFSSTLAVVASVLLQSTTVSCLESYVMPWAPEAANAESNGPLILPNTSTTPVKAGNHAISPILPNTYIVQLQTSGGSTKRDLDPHSEFHQTAKRDAGLSYTTRQSYADQSLFVGLSLTLDNDDDLETLKTLETVAGVWPVVTVDRPAAAAHTKPLSDILKKRFDSVPVNGTNLTIPYIVGDLDVNRPHTMSGVDQVQAAGIKGKGIKIAVIDTGVDFRHPSLGGCFGEGCKVAFGYDFVGDDYPTTVVESPTPLTTCIEGGHGTHVMGEFVYA